MVGCENLNDKCLSEYQALCEVTGSQSQYTDQFVFQLLRKKQEKFHSFFWLHSIATNLLIIEYHVTSCFAFKISAISKNEKVVMNNPYWILAFLPTGFLSQNLSVLWWTSDVNLL